MRTAYLNSTENISVVEVPTPVPQEGEVLVKVKACGICGSDIPRYFQGKVHFFPIVLGHEIAGVVEACGSNIHDLQFGTKVAVVPLMPCQNCQFCSRGLFSLCEKYKFIGSSVNGGLATHIVLPRGNVYKLPANINLEDAVFFETATVALHAVDLLGDVNDYKVGVIGAGTVGLLCAQWLTLLGAKVTLMARSLINEKSKCLGIPYISLANCVQEAQFDKVIDAVGEKESLQTAFNAVKKKGIVSVVGTPSSELAFTSHCWTLINRKELTIKGSWMGYSSPFPGSEWKRTEEALPSGKLRLAEILAHPRRYSLEEVEKAFDLFRVKGQVRGRVLICPEDN